MNNNDFQIKRFENKSNIPIKLEEKVIQIQSFDSKSAEKSEVYVKAFKRAKRLEKAKLIKSRLKTAIFALSAAVLVAGALSAPSIIDHIKSAETTEKYAEDNAITYVEIDEDTKEDEVPWGTLTEEQQNAFANGVAAQLSDAGDILDTVYPVAQESKDNLDFYLNHNINGDYSEQGSIYKDARNHEGLTDDITYIYGHNLIDGNMFGNLSGYANQEYWDGMHYGQDLYNQQKEIYGEDANSFIWTDQYGQYRLDICAAGEYDGNEMINLPINFSNSEDKQMAIDYITARSHIKTDVNLDINSKIVIFQTCKSIDSLSYDESSGNKEFVICKATQQIKFKDTPNEIKNSNEKNLS